MQEPVRDVGKPHWHDAELDRDAFLGAVVVERHDLPVEHPALPGELSAHDVALPAPHVPFLEADDEIQPFFEEIRRAAVKFAFIVSTPIIAAEGGFDAFDDHAEKGPDPDPKHRARTAGCNRGGHAGNVAVADRPADGDAGRLKGRNVPAAAFILPFFPNRTPQSPLQNIRQMGDREAFASNEEIPANGDNKNHKRQAPKQTVEGLNLFEVVQTSAPSSCDFTKIAN